MTSGRSERRRHERERLKRKAFHTVSGAIQNLQCSIPVKVHAPQPDATGHLRSMDVYAVIDTGAQMSAIRADIADLLGLPVIRQQDIHGATGETPVTLPVVLGVVILPIGGDEGFGIAIEMTKTPLVRSTQMLFGMNAMAGSELLVDVFAGRWTLKLLDVQPGTVHYGHGAP